MAPTHGLRAVFLDAGGTLLHEVPDRVEIYREAARSAGIDVGRDEMLRRMRAAHAALPREIDGRFRYSEAWFSGLIEHVFAAGLGLGPRELAAVERGLLERFADPRTFRLHEGARELVRGLRGRGIVVGVVSNWSERLPAILAGLGLADDLGFVLASALERCEKPEREIFERALARAGVGSEDALHAGDDPERDVQGARAAGILPVLVDRTGACADLGCARVSGLVELHRWIEKRLEPRR
jgi:REG-2-like HAD superfamily hydrolase